MKLFKILKLSICLKKIMTNYGCQVLLQFLWCNHTQDFKRYNLKQKEHVIPSIVLYMLCYSNLQDATIRVKLQLLTLTTFWEFFLPALTYWSLYRKIKLGLHSFLHSDFKAFFNVFYLLPFVTLTIGNLQV